MRFIDRPDRPTEIDGWPVKYYEDRGTCAVDRPYTEQLLMMYEILPPLTYIAEKWGYCPVVSGHCIDSSFMLAKELPIWHCNGVTENDISFLVGFAMLGFMKMNRGPEYSNKVAIPINPFTRKPILTIEQAEALDLSEYDPGEPITKNKGFGDGFGEEFDEIRYILEEKGYVPPKVLYWDHHEEESEDDY